MPQCKAHQEKDTSLWHEYLLASSAPHEIYRPFCVFESFMTKEKEGKRGMRTKEVDINVEINAWTDTARFIEGVDTG